MMVLDAAGKHKMANSTVSIEMHRTARFRDLLRLMNGANPSYAVGTKAMDRSLNSAISSPCPTPHASCAGSTSPTLQIFVAIAEEQTLTRASEREGIAVSAASRRLIELERFIGVELFVRHAKGMTLTDVGRSLLVDSQRMLLNTATMSAELREYQQGIRGYVTLLANLSTIVAFLTEDLEPFFLRHAELRIELEERPTDRVIQGVIEGTADMGICSGDADLTGLDSVVYKKDRLVIMMRPDHPLAGKSTLSFAETLHFEQSGLHAQSSIYTRSQMTAREATRSFRRRIHVPGFDAVCRTV